jgi:hypothetical protein
MPELFLELRPGDSTAENVQRMVPPKPTGAKYVPTIALRIEGAGGAENAFAFAVENPTGQDLVITEVVHHLKTKGGTAAAVLDIAVAANATSTGDTVFDGIDISSGATNGTVISSQILADTGTNGNERPKVWNKSGGTNPFLTGKILAAAAAAYVGIILVTCLPLEGP